MVSILRRMARLRALLGIRLGPGAAILPPEVTRIHMEFAQKINDGHFGPRKFWRTHLPRLKYHNPAVPMSVTRTTDQTGAATMTIHFTDPTAAAKSPPSVTSPKDTQSSTPAEAASAPVAAPERIEVIDMKHRHESEILTQLLAVTKAVPVQPTPEDLDQMQATEERQVRSDRDSQRMRAILDKRKEKKAFIEQAKSELAASRQD